MPPAAFSRRSEAQRTEAYASPLRSPRSCWTAFLNILVLCWVSVPYGLSRGLLRLVILDSLLNGLQ